MIIQHDGQSSNACFQKPISPQAAGRCLKPIRAGKSGSWEFGSGGFGQHRIRDEADYWNHVHYIHYNPVKHGWVKRIADWPYSTYHRFCQQGIYDDFDWGLFQTEDWDEQMEFIE